MELGEKLRTARLEAGLSQRQLCGEEITRNMLSQIEHGTARPSMATLQYLAHRLGRSVSFFLEEDALLSPNQQVMNEARNAWDRGDLEETARTLEDFREPDGVYQREYDLLCVLTRLRLAEKALDAGKGPYAAVLLQQAEEKLSAMAYNLPELQRQLVLLRSRTRRGKPGKLAQKLPSIDAELLLRARAALDRGDLQRGGALLDAAEGQTLPDWCLLRGEAYFRQGDYARAAECLHLAEEHYPRETALPLERCYRELGDYRRAYDYACKDRSFRGKQL